MRTRKRKWWLAGLVAMPVLAQAQLYRWVDDKGQVHYTQTPPKSGQFVTPRAAPPPSANPNQEQLNKSLDAADQEAAKSSAQASQDAAQKSKDQASCKQAQDRLKYLEERGPHRLAKRDEKGNISRFTEDDYETERRSAQDTATKFCS